MIQSLLIASRYRRRATQLTQVLLKMRPDLQLRSSPRLWVKPRQGAWWNDVASQFDDATWKDTFRLTKISMEHIGDEIRTYIERQNTNMRRCIPLDKRVAIAVYTLTSVADYHTVEYLFGVGRSTVCQLLHTFCQAVATTLYSIYVCFPSRQEGIKAVVDEFQRQTGFPQCLGALDVCHIAVMPKEERAVWCNEKGSCNTSLLAISDASCKFMYINVNTKGTDDTTHIHSYSSLMELVKNQLDPFTRKVKDVSVPLCLVADGTFPSSEHLLVPYPDDRRLDDRRRNFNVRLLATQSVVRTACDRLKARFRRIGKKLEAETRHIPNIVITCCVLHNVCTSLEDEVETEWMEDVMDGHRLKAQNGDVGSTETNGIRDALANYLTDGSIA